MRQSVQVPVGDQYLSGWLFEKPGSPYVVLVNHGNSGNVEAVKWIAHNLLSAGVSVMLYDYRGYGQSSEQLPDVESICKDGEAAYNYLQREKGYKGQNIILYGQSLGCAVACHISESHEVRAIILQSGFSSLRNVVYQRFPFLQKAPKLIPAALDNQSILSRSSLPLLIIHGDKDKVVPFQNANELYEAACGPKLLVVCHNAGHKLFPESDAQHRTAISDFITLVASTPRPKAEGETAAVSSSADTDQPAAAAVLQSSSVTVSVVTQTTATATGISSSNTSDSDRQITPAKIGSVLILDRNKL